MQGWHGFHPNPGCLCFLELLVSSLQLLVWNLDVAFLSWKVWEVWVVNG